MIVEPHQATVDPLFTKEELDLIKTLLPPKHIAIIPDGNRRWARRHLNSINSGHKIGADAFVTTLRAAQQIGVQTVTIFGFSTENWLRSKEEALYLMHLYEHYIKAYTQEMVEKGIKFHCIGNMQELPEWLQETITQTTQSTKQGSNFTLVVGLNYGGKDELCRAIRHIVEDIQNTLISSEQINEQLINSYLDTAALQNDPDLIIRTSGEERLSNFLLWQSSYSELYFEKTPWPDFRPKHLLRAIIEYSRRNRRKGGD